MRIPNRVKEKLHQPMAVRLRRAVIKHAVITFGAALTAFGFVMFQTPYNITAGGLSGLSIIIREFTNIPEGYAVLALNIPLLVLGWFHLGKWRFVSSTVYSIFAFSAFIQLFLEILPRYAPRYPLTDDKLLACIYAGVLFGLGLGLIQRAGSTIGGASIPARIIHDKTGFPMSQTYLFTDMGVICLGGLVFNWEMALLALLTLVLTGMFSDFTLEGVSQLRSAIIITKKPENMRYAIAHELQRGVSMWEAAGGYSGAARTVLYCTVRRSRVHDLRYTVSRIDPDAMIVIGVVQQAWGGYGNFKLKSE